MFRLTVLVVFFGQISALFDFTTCGSGKTCVLSPDGCESNPSQCIQGLSFKRTSASFLEVELFAKNLPSTATYDSYMAIGFQSAQCEQVEDHSKTPCMANTPVMECSALGGKLMAPSLSWNNDHPKNVRIDNSAELSQAVSLSMSALESSDGQTYCKMMQRIVGAPLSGLKNANEVFQSDPSKRYALVMAVGSTKGSELTHHPKGATLVSKKRYSFS